MIAEPLNQALRILWQASGGSLDDLSALHFTRVGDHLPSVYDVSAFATTVVGAATLAVAEIKRGRGATEKSAEVEIDGVSAAAAFRSEALLKPIGWQLPAAWDPIAGDYRTADGWIRLHTNYDNHRAAALSALGLSGGDKNSVAKAVLGWRGSDLEQAIIAKGGCAAYMYTEEEWATHPLGKSIIGEPILMREKSHKALVTPPPLSPGKLPLAGLRVLDLTRVIAGPECTRVLAAWGAEVLRIDPPGFQEVPAAIPDVTVGKLCASLDLAESGDISQFKDLLRKAHVLVLGYRNGALDKFGFEIKNICELNPKIIIAQLNAYGWTGQLRDRRGFDSLVQMSTGIAAKGAMVARSDKPVPLPAQALDHGAGFVLATGICRSLSDLWRNGENHLVSVSLVGVANFLRTCFSRGQPVMGASPTNFDSTLVEVNTEWGKALRTANPGKIDQEQGIWRVDAGSLGRHKAEFSS